MQRTKYLSLIFILAMAHSLAWAQVDLSAEEEKSLEKGVYTQVWTLKEKPEDYSTLVKDRLVLEGKNNGLSFAEYLKNYMFLPNTFFLVETEAYFKIEQSATYLLVLRNTQGSRILIDGKERVLDESYDVVMDHEFELYLEKGFHKVAIQHWHSTLHKYKECTFWWKNPQTGKREYVPDNYFYHMPRDGERNIQDMEQAEVAELVLEQKVHPAATIERLVDKRFPIPVGGLDFLPDGRLVATAWDSTGSVYLIENPTEANPDNIRYKRIAWGIAEPLGVKVVDGEIYVLQKQELTKLVDEDGDDVTDFYETVCNAWGATGNFHEFSFGLAYKEGFFYAALAIAIQPGGKSTIPQHHDRGQCIKIAKDGSSYTFIAAGLRTPNGINLINDEIFIADNQGDWIPGCKILHVEEGDFFGNLSVDPHQYSRTEVKQPVVWLPQSEIGNSTTQPISFDWGPYEKQMLFGDVTHGGLKRCAYEEVNGQLQGCAFEFTQGFTGGTNRVVWGPDKALYVGCIGNPGNWGEYGKEWWGLDRMVLDIEKPFFDWVKTSAKKNGFELHFNKAMDKKPALDKSNYKIMAWTYEPTINYGGPKIDNHEVEVLSVNFPKDGSKDKVFIELDSLDMLEQYVFAIRMQEEMVSQEKLPLHTTEGYYTLNNVPEAKGYVKPKPKPRKLAKPVARRRPTVRRKPVASKKPIAGNTQQMIAQGETLISKSGCLQCHAMKKKVLGPSFTAIAEKYPDNEANVKKLKKKVIYGGGGVWGMYTMAPQGHLPHDDIEKMVRYILSIK